MTLNEHEKLRLLDDFEQRVWQCGAQKEPSRMDAMATTARGMLQSMLAAKCEDPAHEIERQLATDERVRYHANREATMRETLARAQGECTRLALVKQEQAERLREHEAREPKFLARIAELEDQVSAALEALRLSEQQLYEARRLLNLAGGRPPVETIRPAAWFSADDQATLKRAVDTWGPEAQLGMLGEEALELALAVRRVQRKRDGAWANLAEETADVEIMLGQMSAIANALGQAGFRIAVSDQRRAKLERLRERLEKV